MVTAEFAAGLPILVLLLVMSLGAIGSVTTMLRCQDAAYTAAASVARGESVPSHEPGITMDLNSHGRLVTVVASAEVRFWGARLPALRVSARATAVREPGEP